MNEPLNLRIGMCSGIFREELGVKDLGHEVAFAEEAIVDN